MSYISELNGFIHLVNRDGESPLFKFNGSVSRVQIDCALSFTTALDTCSAGAKLPGWQTTSVNLLQHLQCFDFYLVLLLQTQLPAHLQVRLQACVEGYVINPGSTPGGGGICEGLEIHLEGWLLRWLQKLQFKMGQIEIQSSTASQFYNV